MSHSAFTPASNAITGASPGFPIAALSSVRAAVDQLRSIGYVIFERLAPADILDAVCNELAPWFESTPRCRGDFYGWNTTRVGSVPFKSPSSHALLLDETIHLIMTQVLGPHCDFFQLNLSQAIRIHPGERQQVPHRDDEMWPCPKHGHEFMVNVLWALSDFTAENGATLLWPRSQHRAPTREAHRADAMVAQMPRGSALVYLGSVTHAGGANQSQAPRTGLIFSYCLGWLKQYENAFLAYPPTIARSFPKAVRDLIGYRIHRPNLGNYEGQDPAMALETDSRSLPTVDALTDAVCAELRHFYAGGTS